MDSFDHKFSPSGYPIEDKCKICGKWTMTEEGVRSLGLEIIYSGSTKGVTYEVFLREREKAIAHGVINEEQFLPAKLNKLATEKTKRVAAFNTSDIGMDQNREGIGTGKGSKKKEKNVNLELVPIGEEVEFSPDRATAKGKRKKGIILEKNIVIKKGESKGKNGERRSGATESMALIRHSTSGKEEWILETYIWSGEAAYSEKTEYSHLSFFEDDENLSIAEHLIPYVGMH